MCGRFAQTTPSAELVQLFSLIAGIEVAPRFNLAPTMNVTIVRETPNGRIGQQTRWGLVPGWAPDLKSGGNLFNARSETVFEKRSFAAAARAWGGATLANVKLKEDVHAARLRAAGWGFQAPVWEAHGVASPAIGELLRSFAA